MIKQARGIVLTSSPYLRRGRWIPQRSAEFNGGGCREDEMVLDDTQLSVSIRFRHAT
ncbi:MAG: hypothetical protein ABIN89_12910 [Chitinophagaceae bacterium]